VRLSGVSPQMRRLRRISALPGISRQVTGRPRLPEGNG
jgi:hypothetical protein